MTIVAEFKIDHRQILDPHGRLVAPLPRFAEDLDEVVKMYAAMTRVRVFDAKAVNLQRTGQLGTYPSSLGHEATHVGIGAAMRPEDVLAPVYREYGTQLWRGVTSGAMTPRARDTTLPGAFPLPPKPCMPPAPPWLSRCVANRVAPSPTSAMAARPKAHFTKP